MDPALLTALQDRLDALLESLDLRPAGPDRFDAAPAGPGLVGRTYGGQLLAQALVAAGRTVDGKTPASMHAAFVKAGSPGRPLEMAVDRVRDGRTMATRGVTVSEAGKPLLTAIVSFGAASEAAEPSGAAPDPAPPESMPLLQEWAQRLTGSDRPYGRHWIEDPPPVEFRLPEPPCFFGGTRTPDDGARSHWMRAPADLGDDPLIHTALLTYASDFLLMDMVFHAHPATSGPGLSNGLSLDHAIWWHRSVRFDRWHLYTQQSGPVVGNRGLASGVIHDSEGGLVATTMQEVLVMPVTPR